MADSSWKNLELWERVKWARSRRFRSAMAASETLGMQAGTYRCYERGPDSAKYIRLDYEHAKHFARGVQGALGMAARRPRRTLADQERRRTGRRRSKPRARS